MYTHQRRNLNSSSVAKLPVCFLHSRFAIARKDSNTFLFPGWRLRKNSDIELSPASERWVSRTSASSCVTARPVDEVTAQTKRLSVSAAAEIFKNWQTKASTVSVKAALFAVRAMGRPLSFAEMKTRDS